MANESLRYRLVLHVNGITTTAIFAVIVIIIDVGSPSIMF